ncbi:MAG: hypothetical protein WDO16_18670, partial [Bacteroidota bacterium]
QQLIWISDYRMSIRVTGIITKSVVKDFTVLEHEATKAQRHQVIYVSLVLYLAIVLENKNSPVSRVSF